jgi:hypothetical protein
MQLYHLAGGVFGRGTVMYTHRTSDTPFHPSKPCVPSTDKGHQAVLQLDSTQRNTLHSKSVI